MSDWFFTKASPIAFAPSAPIWLLPMNNNNWFVYLVYDNLQRFKWVSDWFFSKASPSAFAPTSLILLPSINNNNNN